ncbi:hypothetical protein [Nocardioides perillae]|uniref:Uncharacterized protein n=1 Tax=Nocardioides perillae TaxID=1119534 RepID=A0A7Y9UMT0_9ACTN|nr:hypothetical protein [Nocardioides perillae]NYG55721.1 hypothetical protein [Nocardioides perillae]
MPSLLDILRDVVDPAVRAVLTDDEVTAVGVRYAAEGTVQLDVDALGDHFTDWVFQPGAEVPEGGWAERLRSNLVDFVAESPGGWGQDRGGGPPGR